METTQGAFSWVALTLFCVAALYIHHHVARESDVARVATESRDLRPRRDGVDGARYISFASFGSADDTHDVFIADGRSGGNAPRNPHGNYLNANHAPPHQALLPAPQHLARRPVASELTEELNDSSVPDEMERYFIYATGSTPEDIAGGSTVATPEDDVRTQGPTQR